LKRNALISILGVVAVAAISGSLLWRLMVKGNSLGQLGLLGLLIAAALSHLTVVARDMFVPLLLSLTPHYSPAVLGVAAGLGAAAGEVTTYLLGWSVAEGLGEKSDVEDRVERWVNRYGVWAVFIVSLTPLPDTPIVLLAGSRRLPFGKLFVAEVVGKSVLYSVASLMGGFVYGGLEGLFGSVVSSILVVVASLVFSIAVTWRPSRDWVFGWFERLVLKK